ncbi:hypothetical protein B7988_01960 [Fibrobacter sp. UWB1]|uniref:InlB B-repeat-containing protein n=1 Tax=unclassified Fibrobacter TaxID=2634177 RepID=UPI0009174558|nr:MULTISPECIES: InlB B-repeat-containing protein [unclassified Fibrobacter]OWV26957.1 hypothetical protein B7988_01960 [Fibrobacter sp. UWB1]SHL00722.1 Listeria/Bacterioides repeat-containing protein [Fibrobacter sp. UWOV1]
MKFTISIFTGVLFTALSANAATITSKMPTLSDGCYQISDAAELYGFADIVNGTGEGDPQGKVCGKLTQDIVVNESVLNSEGELNSQKDFVPWVPMKDFSGKFDGNNHVIYGLYFNGNGDKSVGLFENASGFQILNLGLEDFYFAGKENVGAFVGFVNDYSKNQMEITNSYAAGLVEGESGVGGFIGSATWHKGSLYISNSYNLSMVKGLYEVGGFIGSKYEDDVYIIKSYNSGVVSGKEAVGGFVGWASKGVLGVYQSYNAGKVVGQMYVGGLLGKATSFEYALFKNVYNKGAVEGGSSVGGLVGYGEGADLIGGGVTIANAYNAGHVSYDADSSLKAGTILGYGYGDGKIRFENCFFVEQEDILVANVSDTTNKVIEDVLGVTEERLMGGVIAGYLRGWIETYRNGSYVENGADGLVWAEDPAGTQVLPHFDWSNTKHYVFFVLDEGGKIEKGHELKYYEEGVETALPDAQFVTREGFYFAGWYDNRQFWGNAVTSVSPKATGTQIFYAKWTTPPVSSSSEESSSSVSSSSSDASSSSETPSSSSEQTTSFERMPLPRFSVYVVNRNLQVAGARVGDRYALFDMQGNVVLRGTVNSSNFNMVVPVSGNYVLRIGNGSRKVSVRF